ncbi:Lysophospholipase L1 [Granulicella pectinivorans]|uniref:Lysophospholipase L1 n=1 Tax=Granulicella pectinivorans TaxID=474950 RepID=A0A1I6LL87_9BACT|nr:GDSL-type esterase/lipase family protein [Granulicella pectinivorans]SFS04206.1 Lysophospholipase L1 [Granulicella pectinivorans]
MIFASPLHGFPTTFSRVAKAVALALPLFCAAQPALFAAKPRPKKSAPAHHAKPAAKTTRKPLAKGRRKPVAHDDAISPERGTFAAESVQATLAESPANPFLYARNLDPFFRALAAQQAGKTDTTIRILQFGDSHTAADYFTGAVRDLLQSRFGNGGLGYQFPGHPFNGYRLAGSSRSQTSGWITDGNHFTHLGDGYVGLGGLSISTERPGESVTLSTTCTTLQIQYLRQPGGGHLHFTDNGTFISDIDTGVDTSPAATDVASPTTDPRGAGTMTYACTPGVHDFELTTFDRAPVRLLGLVTEQPGITYECLGINGAYAPLMLQWNQTLFADYLRQRDPNLIVLAYGTNEAAQSAAHNEDYIYDFNRLLQNLHRIVPEAAILVLGPYDRAMKTGRGRRASWHTFAGTDRIIADQKESCRQYHCAFYDERARQGGPGSAIRWVSAGYGQPDRTHLTGTGYRALAQALYLDLLAAYKKFQAQSDPVN